MSAPQHSLQPSDAELYRRVDEVVHYLWDPIGISHLPGARDEYQSYLLGIFGRLQKGQRDGILEYMKWMVEERMGLSFQLDAATVAADALLAWKQELDPDT